MCSCFGLWPVVTNTSFSKRFRQAIWQIHNANIAAGAEYMRILKIEQDKARAEGRVPPERLDKPASFYNSNDSLSSE
ncbi:hypothetical protein, variant [Puccinia triticina 1-1 BBBD Race 1]|uniref:Uncharacterized protein n=1 Tax=Puccinia triticina (isolate 1-1 / race 1 (BBBD)) TaxID=630390 RepID=A0A180GP58_PUCT1|nr:hypothetical protein, variant [Puccinia triticina 1-1 BBBD Race 1]